MAESSGVETNAESAHPLTARLAKASSQPGLWLAAFAGLLVIFVYRDLFGLSTRFGFAKGVEYWLFRPSDSAPLVILSIVAWLVYRRSQRIRALSMADGRPLLALPFYALSVATYAWAAYTGSLDMRVVSFSAFCFGSVVTLFGRSGLRALWLPCAFVLFAIQMPAPLMLAIIYKLQMWTAEYSGLLLYAIGESALVSGDQIIRATQKFQVVEGCSGMRSIETLTMLTVLMADLFGRRGWHAFLLVLSAPFVAFALNGVRVLTIILNPHSDIAAIHNLQGIAVLMAGLLLIYGYDEILERFLPPRANPPFRTSSSARAESAPRPLVPLVCIVAVAFALVLVSRWGPVWEEPEQAGPSVYALASVALAQWPSEKATRDYIFQGSARYDAIFHYDYDLPEGAVNVFLARGSPSEPGGSALSPMTAHPATGFAELERWEEDLNHGLPPATAWVMRRGKQEVLVWHWFLGRNDLVSESARHLLALDRSPARRARAPVVVRLTTEIPIGVASGRDLAVKKLTRIFERLTPALQELAGVSAL